MKNIKVIVLVLVLCLLLTGCSQKEEPITTEETQITEESQAHAEADEDAAVIKAAIIPKGEYDTSGKVEIMDNNILRISEFNYNGGAPDVYIALGNYDDNGDFIYGELVSPKLEGEYTNEELVYEISQNVDVNQYNAVSIWCHNFSEDFSSGEFNL